jgi:glycerol-3-phosphate acyltransferase PlsX
MRIAIDAMGGDYAPAEAVRGTLAAARADSALQLVLVGPADRLRAEIGPDAPPNVAVENAPQVIDAHEHAVEALRLKPDSSIARCVKLIREGAAQAMVSAGNTGAVVAAATLGLNLLPGVKRAGIAVPMPNPKGFSALIDVGANVNSRPDHLLQYAVMGSLYVRLRDRARPEPTVGLLNVGAEAGKGNELTREAYALLERAPVRFIGNIEGHDVYEGKADVIVCDGFVGNITLKSGEGLAAQILGRIGAAGADHGPTREEIRRIARGTGFAEEGGAPLMGVRGIVIICHGRSRADAFGNAARTAARFVEARLNDLIVQEIGRLAPQEVGS